MLAALLVHHFFQIVQCAVRTRLFSHFRNSKTGDVGNGGIGSLLGHAVVAFDCAGQVYLNGSHAGSRVDCFQVLAFEIVCPFVGGGFV